MAGQTRVLGAALLVLAFIPFFIQDDYLYHLLIMAGIYAALTMSLNLLLGCAGMFSLGHAAFYGLGAYFAALMALRHDFPFLLTVLGSGLFAGVIGALVAFPALRMKGIFLAIGTMGFNEIFRILAINLEDLTGGPAGLPGIPAPEIFGYVLQGPRDFYLLIILVCLVTCRAFSGILRANPGRALIAIKDDEIAAKAVGINLTFYKVVAFGVSAAVAGMSGGLFAYYMTYISPDNFVLAESFSILAMVALGGIGNLPGSIVGAVALVVIPEAFRFLQDYRLFIYGVTIILTIRLLPGGILSRLPSLKRFTRKKSGHAVSGF